MNQIQKNEKLCEICGIPAKSLCINCLSYYCEECYKYVHNKEQNKQHKKEKIDYFVPMDIKCQDHPKDRINLFCIDEKGNTLYLINTIKIEIL